MTMLSFRLDRAFAEHLDAWAERLGVDRSELLREALRHYLNQLSSEQDAQLWVDVPLDDSERSLDEIADWGPAEDWSDWVHAAR